MSIFSSRETFKWGAVALLSIFAIFLCLYFAKSWPFKVLIFASWGLLSAVIFMTTEVGRNFFRFSKEARGELNRVVWPTRQETIQATVMVVVMVALVSLMLWGLDAVLISIIGMLTGQRG